MPADFYGRTAELNLLEQELQHVVASRSARVVAVQGRRQVGKSTLLEHFAEHSGVPYASMTGMRGTPEGIQVSRAVASVRTSKRPLPDWSVFELATPLSSWPAVLQLLRFSLGAGPAVVVLDEFPWANETSPGLDGLLKALLDSELGRLPLLLILVGSDEAMMEQLFEHDRPLFGKADLRLVVNPFNPRETAHALGEGRGAVEVFDAQLVTGGFPALIDQARRYPSIRAFVTASLTSPSSTLVDAAQIRLAGEFSESANAALVLRAIGANEIGVATFSAIAGDLGGGTSAQTAVTRAVELLANTKRIVAIDLPAGDTRSRLKRYRIADPYLRFWFHFVEPHLRNIEVGRSDIAIEVYGSLWPTWRGKAIEPLVREGFLRLAPRLGEPFASIESVEAWWDRQGRNEFDLLGTNSHAEHVALGSIKWRERTKFDAGELAELASGRAVIRGAAAARLVAICPAGARAGVEPDLLIGADQLLNAWSQ